MMFYFLFKCIITRLRVKYLLRSLMLKVIFDNKLNIVDTFRSLFFENILNFFNNYGKSMKISKKHGNIQEIIFLAKSIFSFLYKS